MGERQVPLKTLEFGFDSLVGGLCLKEVAEERHEMVARLTEKHARFEEQIATFQESLFELRSVVATLAAPSAPVQPQQQDQVDILHSIAIEAQHDHAAGSTN